MEDLVKLEPKSQQKGPGATSPHIQSTRLSQAGHDGRVIMRHAGDHLVLSAHAEQFRRIRLQLEAVSTAPNTARVAKLRDLIARGLYSVDGRAVAEAMLADEAIGQALAAP
jgi:flagellar biosynthesis anti-sigma factor FlgM